MKTVRRAFVGCSLLIGSTVLAQAAEPIKLRVADLFPKGHYLVTLLLEPAGWSRSRSAPTARWRSIIIRPSKKQGHRHAEADADRRGRHRLCRAGAMRPTRCRCRKWRCCRARSTMPARARWPIGNWRARASSPSRIMPATRYRLLLVVVLPQYRILLDRERSPIREVADVAGLKLRSTWRAGFDVAGDRFWCRCGWPPPTPMNCCRAAPWTACCFRWKAWSPTAPTSW